MVPTTLAELDFWLSENKYDNNYTVGRNIIYEGFGIDKSGELFIWYYTERGQRENLHYFRKEAVQFAIAHITLNK